ncbi:allantoate amidohydrolase [Nocardioides salsibiostraticola]
MADDFERMWADLLPVGRSAASGGYFRQPFLAAETEARMWFTEQAAARGLRLERDLIGNVVAWWDPPSSAGVVPDVCAISDGVSSHKRQGLSARGVLTGSHLDSVLDGGAYDGPLGVVSSLAAIDELRGRGFVPTRPLGVAVFVEEEGSRFGLACLGSRLATGATTWAQAQQLRDRDGVWFADALADAVQEGPGAEADLRWDLSGLDCFVELHVEQGRDLIHREAAIGVASGIWPHGRYRFDVTGEANHAGSTRMEDRADPMLTYAMTALAAAKQARLADARATFGRLDVSPNSTNAVASRVTAWLDARAASEPLLADLVAGIERQAVQRAGRDGTHVVVTAESVSGEVGFAPDLAARIAADHSIGGQGGGDWPIIATQAGHDAGVLSAAGVPTSMLFVRNPTGVSHSPAETAEMADCLTGVTALADTLERVLR